LRDAVRRHDVTALLDDERPVEAVMSSAPHVIGPDAAISDAARLLVSRHINALPVVDDDVAVVGIITSVDCLLAALEQPADA
jgi:CBS domain-containing protein